MKIKHVALAVAAFAVVVVIGIVAYVWKSELPAVAEGSEAPIDAAQVRRGFELAQLGNCANCHTTQGGAAYAGGYAMETPFGTLYSTNITPDRDTGIGTWSLAAFTRAMREGVDREGHYLYPAFPYNHFTHATDDDISALYAFLRTVAPVENIPPKNGIGFPFNIRPMIAGWNLLFLKKGPVMAVADQSDDWNYGHYLVEGIGHCGACHTPRNLLGAEKSSQLYAGAEIDGWFAPPLQGNGARAWSTPQMLAYLSTGFSSDHGAAAGPMAETAANLGHADTHDVAAIADYVASLTPEPASAAVVDNVSVKASAEVSGLWNGACAKCHDSPATTSATGVGPSLAVPLSMGASVGQEKSINAVRTIVNGVDAYRDQGGPYMPAFGDILTKAQIAELAQYVRARYSSGPAWNDIDDEVGKALAARNEGSAQ